jgi:DHA1 family tetracycline resistance protein-like MFS transporter
VVKRLGDRATMVVGLGFGAVGIAAMGLAPTDMLFIAAMFPNALWGLAMPTIQSLMTQHVSESEQGQLQGANNSVGAIAGIVSPLFFGAVYSLSVGVRPTLPFIGSAFLIAALILAGAASIGWRAGRQFKA